MERTNGTDEMVEKSLGEGLEIPQLVASVPDFIGFGGVRRLKRDFSRRETRRFDGGLALRMVQQRPAWAARETYYAHVLAVVLVVSDLRSGDSTVLKDERIAFQLGVMSDHCLGLPADGEIVDFLKRTFIRHSHSWTRLHCAQCVGYLAGGLSLARPLFAILFDDPDERTRTRAGLVLARVLENQDALLGRMKDGAGVPLTETSEGSGQVSSPSTELSAFAWAASKVARVAERNGVTSRWRLHQTKGHGGNRQMELRRVIGEVEAVSGEDVIVQVSGPGVGWYSLVVPSRALPGLPKPGQCVDVDVWCSKGVGVLDFGIPGDAKLYPPSARKAKPPSCLPPEPEDFNNSDQMQQYLAGLKRFFRLD